MLVCSGIRPLLIVWFGFLGLSEIVPLLSWYRLLCVWPTRSLCFLSDAPLGKRGEFLHVHASYLGTLALNAEHTVATQPQEPRQVLN